MNRAKKLITTLVLPLFIFTACGQTEQPPAPENQTEGVARKQTPKKEVTVFDLSSDSAEVSIVKTGTTESEILNEISPELSGNISELHVEVGQIVEEGDLLVTLGDSLSTDQQDLTLESSEIAYVLQRANNEVTEDLTESSLESAQIAADIAYNNYLNAVSTRQTSYDTFQSSLMDAEIAFNNAKHSYFTAKDNYETAKDTEGISSIDLNNLKLAKETAENTYIQAENTIHALKVQNKQTLDNLNLTVANALNQYETALVSVENAKLQGDLQMIAAESQLLQAETQLKSAELNNEYLTLNSPIDGIITAIHVDENDSVSPGQTVITIEDPTNNIATTSLTQEEALLVSKTESVNIISDYGTLEGEIVSFSPIANSQSKKIDVEILVEESSIPSEEFVEIEFIIDTTDSIFVPLNSVNQSNGKYFVQTVTENNKVKILEVEIGEIISSYIEITTGLDGDEKIIDAGANFLTDGERVIIANN